MHKVLAIAFTKIRGKGEAPKDWASNKVILMMKGKSGATDDLSNSRIISLTLNIRKSYHTLEAQRTMDFMVANKYLDPAAQKAFMDGVNGCVEHVTVIQEIIQNATHNNKTVHNTWFDLEDAFGSVSHMLIPITSLYSKLEGQIKTKNLESDIFLIF